MVTQNVTPDSTLNEVLYHLSLSPNPATTQVTLTWSIYDQLNNCNYTVQSLNDGSVVASGNIGANTGSLNINLGTAQAGYYVVKIYNGGQLKAQEKLVVK